MEIYLNSLDTLCLKLHLVGETPKVKMTRKIEECKKSRAMLKVM